MGWLAPPIPPFGRRLLGAQRQQDELEARRETAPFGNVDTGGSMDGQTIRIEGPGMVSEMEIARERLMRAAGEADRKGEGEVHQCLMMSVAALDDAREAARSHDCWACGEDLRAVFVCRKANCPREEAFWGARE